MCAVELQRGLVSSGLSLFRVDCKRRVSTSGTLGKECLTLGIVYFRETTGLTNSDGLPREKPESGYCSRSRVRKPKDDTSQMARTRYCQYPQRRTLCEGRCRTCLLKREEDREVVKERGKLKAVGSVVGCNVPERGFLYPYEQRLADTGNSSRTLR